MVMVEVEVNNLELLKTHLVKKLVQLYLIEDLRTNLWYLMKIPLTN